MKLGSWGGGVIQGLVGKILDITGAFPLQVINRQSKIELTMVARPSGIVKSLT